MRRIPDLCVALSLLIVSASAWTAEPLRILRSGDYARVLARHGDAPFIVSFWSLDCPPCYRELAFWGEQQRKAALLPLVLISTDNAGDAEEIGALLDENGLQDSERWVFGAPAQQLRFEVDRRWQGELPRTYLIQGGTVVDAVSGVVDAGWFDQIVW